MGYLIKTTNSLTYISDADGSNKIYFEAPPMWVNKLQHVQRMGSIDRTLDGGAVLQVMPRGLVGLPITLDGYISATRAALLQSKADAGAKVLFSEDNGSTTIECYFDYSKETPLEIEYFDANKVFMKGKIHLIRA